jgi:hypothetical protein
VEPSQRVVTQIPVIELWNEKGPVDAVRGPYLGEADVVRTLQAGDTFVLADIGASLRWVPAEGRFRFWKSEVKNHLVPREADEFKLEDFPGQYCYVATGWRLRSGASIVLLEKHH